MKAAVVTAVATVLACRSAGANPCRRAEHRLDADVVGYTRCARFAGWMPRATGWLEVGAAGLRVEPGLVEPTTAPNTAQRVVVTEPQRLGLAAFRARIGASFRNGLYLVSQVDLARAPGPVLAVDGGAPMTAASVMSFGEATIGFGERVDVGRISLGAELAPGLRIESYLLSATHATVATQSSLAVAARARADVWLGPWLTVGAQASVDLRARADVSLGVVLGLHLSAYDAR